MGVAVLLLQALLVHVRVAVGGAVRVGVLVLVLDVLVVVICVGVAVRLAVVLVLVGVRGVVLVLSVHVLSMVNRVSELAPDYFTKHLADVDPEIAQVVADEERRQEATLEMIASENFVPQAVLDAQGSVLTNKYAEGYPGRRYYGGCEHVDVAEELAISRAKELFGAEFVNVQPHAGAQANAAAYHALLQPGDGILGMKLDHGGHLSHGMKINFSGRLYDIVAYGVREQDSVIDMDAIQRLAEEFKPKLVLAGWSAYPRQLDFARLPRDRRLDRRPADGGHGPLRRPRRRGRAPQPGALRRRGHHHRAQDARRRARRHDHGQGRAREEAQLGRVPRPAGRSADARRGRQGGGAEDRPVRALPRAPAAHRAGRQGRGRGAARPGA